MKGITTLVLLGFISQCAFFKEATASFPYYGTKIGALTRLHHGVSGDVYAVDSRTIFIKKFNYDGEAPAAYFYVGHTSKPSNEGAFRLRDERGGTASLTRRYRNKDITLSLPEGKTLRDIKWFSVWCDEFAVNFGDVVIPSNLDFPRPQKISALKGVHGVSSDNIVIVDAQTLLVPNFSYDGEAPDAKFWVGRGQRPSASGLRIPDENGKENPLRRYERKTIVLTLPEDLTIFDIGHFGVWCEAFTVDFGHVRVPEGLNVPPSLKMLGISPQSKLNCEVLYDDAAFEVRWAVAGESIVVQLVAKLAPNQYMSFGISPVKQHSQMIGADVVVAWVDDQTGKGFAQDYYLEDKSQCSGSRGTCPDVNIEDNTNSIRLLNAAMINGYSIVTYQRSLLATDRLDLPISINGSEAIVWAIGPLNERKEASFHTHYTQRDQHIDFGRLPVWNCPMPEGSKPPSTTSSDDEAEEEHHAERDNGSQATGAGYPPARPSAEQEQEFYDNRAQALQRPTSNRRQSAGGERPVPTPKPVSNDGAWDIPAIQCFEPEDGVFYAQMGPTGGKHGYSAITGHVGWGISWYINGLLIPEIHVVRGKTYTFVVEGGNNPDVPAKYHPFYITDDPVGGFEHKREEEKKAVRIFAGVHRSRSGQVTPTGVGRLCNWTPDVDGPPADDYQSFGAYQRTLTLKCDAGEPGVITWKPDRNTPDTVYYHCFTHRYLGWKIHVHDSCDDPRFSASASEKHEVRVPFDRQDEDNDYAAESSLRRETKVSPNDNFLLKHQTDLIKNHNMNGTPPKLTFEITKSSEITKLISDGIRAAEALEESIVRNQTGNTITNTNQHRIFHNNNNINHSDPKSAAPTQLSTATGPFRTTGSNEDYVNLPGNPLPVNVHHGNPHTQHLHTQTHTKLPIFASPHSPHFISHNQLYRQHQLHLSTHSNSTTNNLANLPAFAQKTIGLSEYLRPPQNAPLFHPVKLPGRRPYPGPIKKVPPSRPVLPQQLPRHPPSSVPTASLLPQPSLIVNHYRKPVPGLLKPFIKEKPFPIQPIAASVLLLGQPSDLGVGQRKTDTQLQLHLKNKPTSLKVPVPYTDLEPQNTLQNQAFLNSEKKPSFNVNNVPLLPNVVITRTTPGPVFKEPFDIHEVKEEPTLQEIAAMKPAINQGFKPDSVVVESGFRPIIRNDGTGVQLPADAVNQVAHRREDPGTEIDEVMETDTLFLTAQKGTETQNFEPMFIPSPPDSTNVTVIVKNSPLATDASTAHSPTASALRIKSVAASNPALNTQLEPDESPTAEKLRIPTLEELLKEAENDAVLDAENEENSTEASEKKQNIVVPTEPKSVSPKAVVNDDLQEMEADMDSKMDFLLNDHELELYTGEEPEEEDEDVEHEMEQDQDEDEDEKMTAAAERIDTYYLPPDNKKIPNSNLPSGAIITYDGKSVIDSSLVLPPKLDAHDGAHNLRRLSPHTMSHLEELIRTTPQFATYRGELPPPIEEYLSTERSTQLESGINSITEHTNSNSVPVSFSSSLATSTAALPSINTQFTSSSLSSSSSPLPISTKLQLLRKNST